MTCIRSIIAFLISKPGNIPAMTIGLGIFACILPYFFYILALKTIPAGTALSLRILEPMAATLFGVVLFNEKLGVFSVIGMVLILGAVCLLSRAEE